MLKENRSSCLCQNCTEETFGETPLKIYLCHEPCPTAACCEVLEENYYPQMNSESEPAQTMSKPFKPSGSSGVPRGGSSGGSSRGGPHGELRASGPHLFACSFEICQFLV